MALNLRHRSFLTILDYTPAEIDYLANLGKTLKNNRAAGIVSKPLEGKNIVILFQKTSTRTRCSFEVAGSELGMGVTYIDPSSSQFGKKESVEDTAKVLGRFYDGIEFRGYKQTDVECLAKNSNVPVWNGLTDEFHPTQMIADLITIKEEFGDVKGRKLVYFGDAKNNMGNSLMILCAKMGMHFVAACPNKYQPAPALVKQCKEICKVTHGTISFESNAANASIDADVLYGDVWVSMGEAEEVWDNRIKELQDYQINGKLMAQAKKTAIFMHCLPAYHGLDTTVGSTVAEKFGKKYPSVKNGEMECTDEVVKGHQSRCFDQAENRMHSIKAIILATIGY